jgi:hypothetical protein
VNLNARLGASEPCPLKKGHAEVYGDGIKGIALPMKFKLPVDSFLLGKLYHVIGEIFKYLIIKKLGSP